jgi:protein TonB
MATLALHPALPLRALPQFNWPRVTAWSGSLGFHLALALALLVPPVAMELRSRIDPDPIIVTLTPAQPKQETIEPALPVPERKRKPVAAPPMPNITITKPEFVPTATKNAIAPPADAAPTASSTTSASGDSVADTAPSALAYKNRTTIPYPRIAAQRHEQGTVVLRVLVGTDGLVQQIEIDRSSGSHDLDNAARDAVRRWSFQPGTRGGVPYAAWALVPISFSLP